MKSNVPTASLSFQTSQSTFRGNNLTSTGNRDDVVSLDHINHESSSNSNPIESYDDKGNNIYDNTENNVDSEGFTDSDDLNNQTLRRLSISSNKSSVYAESSEISLNGFKYLKSTLPSMASFKSYQRLLIAAEKYLGLYIGSYFAYLLYFIISIVLNYLPTNLSYVYSGIKISTGSSYQNPQLIVWLYEFESKFLHTQILT